MAREGPSKADFIRALTGAVERRGEAGLPLDPDAVLDDVGRDLGVVLVSATFEQERVAAPFPEPPGFIFPRKRPRRMTARRRDTLVAQLATGKRAETRRSAVLMLGSSLGDPAVIEALRAAASGDRDPYVRGEALMCLGLAGTEPAAWVLAAAEALAAEAASLPRSSDAYDLAREAEAYGLLGAVVAATRDGRGDLAAALRSATESIGTEMTLDHSTLPARQRRELLALIGSLPASGRAGAEPSG